MMNNGGAYRTGGNEQVLAGGEQSLAELKESLLAAHDRQSPSDSAFQPPPATDPSVFQPPFGISQDIVEVNSFPDSRWSFFHQDCPTAAVAAPSLDHVASAREYKVNLNDRRQRETASGRYSSPPGVLPLPLHLQSLVGNRPFVGPSQVSDRTSVKSHRRHPPPTRNAAQKSPTRSLEDLHCRRRRRCRCRKRPHSFKASLDNHSDNITPNQFSSVGLNGGGVRSDNLCGHHNPTDFRNSSSVSSSYDDDASSHVPQQFRPKATLHKVPIMSIATPQAGSLRPIPAGMFGETDLSSVDKGISQKYARIANQRNVPFTHRLNPFMALKNPAQTDSFSINHNWLAFGHKMDYWFRDRFHMLISISLGSLIVCLVLLETLWALVLSMILAIVTLGDITRCLGGASSSYIDYYFFTVETMFTLGYGTPRYPSCTATNIWVSFAVMMTNLLHGTIIGIIFAKFSSGTTRRYALAFSPQLCGAVSVDFVHSINDRTDDEEPPNTTRHNQMTSQTFDFVPTEDSPNAEGSARVVSTPGRTQSAIQVQPSTPIGRQEAPIRNNESPSSDPDKCIRASSCQSPMHHANDTPRSPHIFSSSGITGKHIANSVGHTAVDPVSSHTLKKCYLQTYTSTGIKRSALPSQLNADAIFGTADWGLTYIADSLRRSFDVRPRSHRFGTTTTHRTFQPSPSITALKRQPLHEDSLAYTDELYPTVPSIKPTKPDDDTKDDIFEGLKKMCWEEFTSEAFHFSLSFRLMNITDSLFFDPKLSLFLLYHQPNDLTITQILQYHTDIPLEFMEMPITVTIDSRDSEGPLNGLSISDIVQNGQYYELVVLFTFMDNQSSRTIDLRKSWTFNDVSWGFAFKNILRKAFRGPGAYEIDIEALDEKNELCDPLNLYIAKLANEVQTAKATGRGGHPLGTTTVNINVS